jgi:hypothetical protein
MLVLADSITSTAVGDSSRFESYSDQRLRVRVPLARGCAAGDYAILRVADEGT